MKRILAAFFAALCVCMTVPAGAQSLPEPSLSASSAILVDAETGRVLYGKGVKEERAIASITKLMTALVAVNSVPDLTREVTVKREYTLAEGSSMYLKVGEKLTLEALLYGLLLVSGNDAALAIADFCAGDVETFVGWMNDCADELGMNNTQFANPNGLPNDAHYSTAADMAKLARVVMENETLSKIVATKSISMGNRSLSNHNKLLWQYEGCIGMKTGYTDKAGRTLVSCAEREGQRLIVVTLNAPNDWKDHAALFDYGFANYPRQMLALSGRQIKSVPVTGSLVRMVAVTTSEDVYYPLTVGEKITSKLQLPKSVPAPIFKGAIVGSMTFYLGDKEICKTYLECAASVANDQPRERTLMERVLDFFHGRQAGGFLAAFYSEIKL